MKNNINTLENFAQNRRADSAMEDQMSTLSDYALHRFSTECSQKLSELKNRVARNLSVEFGNLSSDLLRQAVNEADALVATTPFPALLMPVLAEEKVRDASRWAARQRMINQYALALAA